LNALLLAEEFRVKVVSEALGIRDVSVAVDFEWEQLAYPTISSSTDQQQKIQIKSLSQLKEIIRAEDEETASDKKTNKKEIARRSDSSSVNGMDEYSQISVVIYTLYIRDYCLLMSSVFRRILRSVYGIQSMPWNSLCHPIRIPSRNDQLLVIVKQ
jgi:hypothetical protein